MALGALACANAAAQTNVQLYGSVDAGVDFVNNVRGDHLWAVNSGKRSPDRIGFKGTEDLGGGRAVLFKLETGFNSDLGTQANPTKLFNRFAVVGISDASLGTITLGHTPDFAYEYVGSITNSVPGISWAYSPGNLDNLANIFGMDNMVRYETPDLHGLQLGVMNSFGEDATNFGKARAYSAGFRYSGGKARVVGSYSMYHNRTADLKTAFGVTNVLGQSLATAPFNADKFAVGALGVSYAIGAWVPHATWTQVSLDNARGQVRERNFQAGVNIDLSGGKKTRILGVSASRSTFEQLAYRQLNLFITQYLSPNTQVYAGAAVVRASGAGAVAGAFGYTPSSTTSQVLARTGLQVQF